MRLESDPRRSSKPRTEKRAVPLWEPGQGEEQRVLGAVIRRRREDILDRWLHRLQAELDVDRADPTDLKNALPDYLTKLADALERADATAGEQAWMEVARHHAVTRVRLGFDIAELVREFTLLRRVLFEVAREEGVMDNDRQAERIVELIGSATAAAVQSYVDARDYEARRVEAGHVAFITHELRNPLGTAMLTATQLADAPAAKRARLWELLHRSHRRLRDLVDSVLATEEVDAVEVVPSPAKITLEELLGPLTIAAELAAQAKGLTFTATIDPKLVVYVDRDLAVSAVQNVVDNAIKYTDAGGVVITVEEQPTRVVVHVYDSCAGLSEQELSVIFEPFRRGRTGKAGSGLGLTIARRALQAQGGAIGGESAGEKGCHFWLTLPKAGQ